MALSYQDATSDGTLVLLDISIDYFDRDEITVLFDGVPTVVGWSWVGVSDKKIAFAPAVPIGVEIRVQRRTNVDTLRHEFAGGAKFSAAVLDEQFTQTLRVAQEAQEGVNPATDQFSDLDMHGFTLLNIRDAVGPQEPVTLGQVLAADSGTVLGRLASPAAGENANLLAFNPALTTLAGSLAAAVKDVGVSIKNFPFLAYGDGTTDDTAAVQAAIDSGIENLYVPTGNFILTTVTIDHSVQFNGPGTFKRKANYETDNTSAGAAGNTMIDITAHNVRVTFNGVGFDGNEANQNVNTPSGALVRAYDLVGGATDVLAVDFLHCTFKNMTRAAITMKGAIASLGKEVCTVIGGLFINGRPGIGSGDPRSANASGFAPNYIGVNDKFRLHVSGSWFLFMDPLQGTNPLDYAPTAIRFTRVDATTNDEGSGGTVLGNFFYRCGRGTYGYTGTPNANNALGVVEAYTVGRDITISANVFDTCYASCVRAKVSVDQLIVSGNIMRNTLDAGVAVGPMAESVGTQTGRIVVSGNTVRGADIVGISVVGQTPDTVTEVIVTDNIVSGVTNIDSSAGGNESAITVRQATRPTIAGNIITDCAAGTGVAGIRTRLCAGAIITGNSIKDTSSHGIYAQSCSGDVVVSSNTTKTTNGSGVVADQSGTMDITVSNNQVDGAVSIGISVASARYAQITANKTTAISSSNRGYNVGSGVTFASVMGNTTDATTPLFWTLSGNVNIAGNSWNPTISYRSAAPNAGTWKVSDQVWNTAPAAAGAPGWVCVTTGTLGTLAGVTASTTASSTAVVVNTATGLAVGNYITIVGVTGTKRITAISGLNVTVDVACDATVAGAAVAYFNAVFKAMANLAA